MSSGIWVSPDKFIEFSETVDRAALQQEMASRTTAWDFSSLLGLLPDPDQVLRQRGDGPEVLEGLLADAHVISVVQTRKLGTLRREFRWQAGSVHDEKPSPEAEQLREQLAEDLERVDLYRLVSEILDAPYYGYTPVEILWRPEGSRLRITDLIAKPRRWFGFDPSNRPRFIGAGNPEGDELPFGKFVFARHFPTYDNPYGLRLLSRCFWPVTFKRGGIKFWVTFAEKYGMPFLFGRYAKGATPPEQRELLNNLAKMVQDAVAVAPEGSTVELLGGSGGKSGSGGAGTYDRLVAVMDGEISKAIMGQTLTAETSSTGGAYSQSKTHEEVLETYREADEKLVKTAMEEIAWLYGQINAPGVPTPTFDWWEEENPKKEFAERDKLLGEGDSRLRFTKTYYVRRYGLQEDDFELVDPPAPEPGPAAGGKEFAEGGEFTPEQQALERLAEDGMTTGAAAFGANEELFVRLVRESSSYDEVMEKLLAAYPELTATALQESMEQVLLAGDLFGRWTVGQEGDDDAA